MLPTDYQNFIATSRYARWLDDEGRRETWSETVSRYVDYMHDKVKFSKQDKHDIEQAILGLEVMPSMRALMTAGEALDRDNTAGYNCSYLSIDDPKCFDEAMYILLCGTGVGFSVEREYINKLPEIPEKLFKSDTTIVIKDSKEGWAKGLRQLIALLYAGEIPTYNVSKVRPAGARLKTFGGRASGPAPLVDLFNFTINLFTNSAGKKLTSYDCHSLMCKIGEVVVVGGVRRSAMISLSNLSDIRMRQAKTGNWYETAPHMALSNNSVSYTDKPNAETFMREWTSLIESKSGERGIFNRVAAQKQAKKNGRRNPNYEFGTNPCSEIILRGPRIDEKTGKAVHGTGGQFCNLTEVVIRATDTNKELSRKIRLATILGTAQATLTKFPYLRKVWTDNTEEERLLGVSLTGIMDNVLTNGKDEYLCDRLRMLRQVAVDTNKEYAKKWNIPQSTAITCVKPSGTVSQLCDSASGIHARHSNYYIRTVRGDNKDPLTNFMIDMGVPNEPDVMKPDATTVFSFPMKSPDNSTTRNDMSAVDQLTMWLMYQQEWCEHKPSCTVTVRDHEWMDVGAFVYRYFNEMSGVSFLPHSDHVYQQAPYQDCTKEEYNAMLKSSPENIDWNRLMDYEKEDTTAGSQTFACSGDVCEIVDIGA